MPEDDTPVPADGEYMEFFLCNTRPGGAARVSDLAYVAKNDRDWLLNVPELVLWCDKCQGYLRFKGKTDRYFTLSANDAERTFLTYRCKN